MFLLFLVVPTLLVAVVWLLLSKTTVVTLTSVAVLRSVLRRAAVIQQGTECVIEQCPGGELKSSFDQNGCACMRG